MLFRSNYFSISKPFTLGFKFNACFSTQGVFENYTSTVIQTPAFTPTPHSRIIFNSKFHAPQYIGAGIIPIWNIYKSIKWRNEFYFFEPIKPILRSENKAHYGKAFTNAQWLAESTIVFDLRFATFGIFLNKYSSPVDSWNVGLNLGFLLFAPKF